MSLFGIRQRCCLPQAPSMPDSLSLPAPVDLSTATALDCVHLTMISVDSATFLTLPRASLS